MIGVPFKLSSFQARTLRPASSAQGLHVDVARQSPDWPLLGFILMVDEFRPAMVPPVRTGVPQAGGH